MTNSEQIISEIFGTTDRIPIFDQMAYDLPCEFWQSVQQQVNAFELTDLQHTTLIRLYELAKEYKYENVFFTECSKVLNIDVSDIQSFFDNFDKVKHKLKNITELNDHLLELFSEDGLRIDCGKIKSHRQNRLNIKRREITRLAYRQFEEQRTTEAFKTSNITEPSLMIDRIVFFVFSDKHMTYKPNIKDTIDTNSADYKFMLECDREMVTRQQLRDAKFDDEDIDKFCPVNLDHEFDLMKHRSLFDKYTLTSKPKLVRDGSGMATAWRENGFLYKFLHQPPSGRPISLTVSANMQTLTWQEVLSSESNSDELQKEYNDQFLKDSNFIPSGRVDLYQKYESKVFHELHNKVRSAYINMMDRNGFHDVEKDINFRVSQMELCWNLPVPIDIGSHLSLKYDQLRFVGLHPQLDAKTPLMHTKFMSDVDTGDSLFDHKEYLKAKSVFRNELILGSTLKNQVTLQTDLQGSITESISDLLINDIKLAKSYLFFKLHRRYEQVTGASPHGYYNFLNSYDINVLTTSREESRRNALRDVLDSYDDLPTWLKDIQLFDVLVDQNFLTRSFFKNLTDKQYRTHVRDDPIFTKTSHGKFRLIHPAVINYRKVRQMLSEKSYTTDDFLSQS